MIFWLQRIATVLSHATTLQLRRHSSVFEKPFISHFLGFIASTSTDLTSIGSIMQEHQQTMCFLIHHRKVLSWVICLRGCSHYQRDCKLVIDLEWGATSQQETGCLHHIAEALTRREEMSSTNGTTSGAETQVCSSDIMLYDMSVFSPCSHCLVSSFLVLSFLPCAPVSPLILSCLAMEKS